MSIESPPRWCLTQRALDRLLERLHDEPEEAAREYEAIRRRLVTFFVVRKLESAEALADEVIDRVARRLEQGERIEHPRAYFHGVAVRVAMERTKSLVRERAAIRAHGLTLVPSGPSAMESEARLRCLERCLQALPAESRELIARYYRSRPLPTRDDRKELAERLGMTYTSLKVRVHRIRGRLEVCLRSCLEGCDER